MGVGSRENGGHREGMSEGKQGMTKERVSVGKRMDATEREKKDLYISECSGLLDNGVLFLHEGERQIQRQRKYAQHTAYCVPHS